MMPYPWSSSAPPARRDQMTAPVVSYLVRNTSAPPAFVRPKTPKDALEWYEPITYALFNASKATPYAPSSLAPPPLRAQRRFKPCASGSGEQVSSSVAAIIGVISLSPAICGRRGLFLCQEVAWVASLVRILHRCPACFYCFEVKMASKIAQVLPPFWPPRCSAQSARSEER